MRREHREVAELVVAAREGDQEAWSALVETLSPLIWGIARGYGLTRFDAGDVSQTTWLQFARFVNKIEDPRKAPGWLATAARRECQRVSRRLTRPVATAFTQTWEPDDPTEAQEEVDARTRSLWKALESLDGVCRVLVRMLLNEPPPSYQLIADTLGLSVNNVGPRKTRCLRALRVAIEKDERFLDEC